MSPFRRILDQLLTIIEAPLAYLGRILSERAQLVRLHPLHRLLGSNYNILRIYPTRPRPQQTFPLVYMHQRNFRWKYNCISSVLYNVNIVQKFRKSFLGDPVQSFQ